MMDEKCKDYPKIPTVFPPVNRIIVIGDIHGDFQLAIDLLKLGKVIDDKNNWIGNDTFVVQCGDQIDRCRPNGEHSCIHPDATFEDEGNDIKILEFFTDLDKQAIKDGGRVISLLGNHEHLNVLAQFQYVSVESMKEDYKISKKELKEHKIKNKPKNIRKYAFARGNKYANFLGCTRKSIVVIGSFLFVHAGVILKNVNNMGVKTKDDLDDFNNQIAKWLLGILNDKKFYDYVVSMKSIFWARIFGELPKDLPMSDPKCVKYVKNVLETFNVKGIICGHTPQFVYDEGINSTCDKSVYRVDTGSSKAFHYFNGNSSNRKPQILEIIDDGKKMNIYSL